MAVAALKSNAFPIAAARYLGLGSAPVLKGIELAAQTYKKGAPLIADSGSLKVAAADATSGIIGFALRDATGTTGAEVLYVPALPNVVFEATLEDETNEDHVLAQASHFTKYALQVDDNGIWYLDENDTGNGVGLVVGFKDAVGATRPRVYFIVDISATIYG